MKKFEEATHTLEYIGRADGRRHAIKVRLLIAGTCCAIAENRQKEIITMIPLKALKPLP